jgi:tetratricopeptide (TPR) repeat protein
VRFWIDCLRAIEEYETALRIKPDYVEARSNFATALSGIPGRLPEAIREYETALRINPESAETHFDLGIALSRTPDRRTEAIAQFEEALRIRPDLQSASQMIERLKAARSR